MTNSKRIALLVDRLVFRRAVLENFLVEWARDNEVELVALSPTELLEHADETGLCVISIFAIGGETIDDSEVERQVRVVGALAPASKMAIISDLDVRSEVKAALSMGFDGFLPSNISPDLALRALTFILKGGSYFPPSAIGGPSDEPGSSGDPPDNAKPAGEMKAKGKLQKTVYDEPEGEARVPGLTERQSQVLMLVQEGCPNKVIANRLGMTEATVKVHMRQIMNKLGAENRTQVAISASKLRSERISSIAIAHKPSDVLSTLTERTRANVK